MVDMEPWLSRRSPEERQFFRALDTELDKINGFWKGISSYSHRWWTHYVNAEKETEAIKQMEKLRSQLEYLKQVKNIDGKKVLLRCLLVD
jgi:hypothetical protein